ncbi:MAG: glycosyltransferase [Thermodesulfovibrionales bacterium]|nr:glycosyltransferase [Thermodesulfovibrionales bacterium]
MVNILYLFVTLPIGGAEEHLLTVLKNIDQTTYHPIVCCIREKGEIGEEIEKMGFEVIAMMRKSKMWDIKIVTDILRIIRDRKIHLVHTHLYHANMYGRIASLIARKPVIATEHNIYPYYKMKRRVINWLLAKKTDRIIAVSEMVKKEVMARDWIKPSKVEVIYSGIDMTRFSSSLTRAEARQRLGIPMDCFLIGNVSRLIEQKGQIFLINAMSIVNDAIPGVKLVVVGAGPLEPYLKNEVSTRGLNQYVKFIGSRRDIPDVLKAMDVFVLPSLWEGLGIVLLEAMALSLPVIATPVGGVVEIVHHGINGLIVPPRNEIALAESIIELYKDDKKRKIFGERGLEMVREKFTSSNMVRHLESVYQSVTDFLRFQ